MKIFFLLWLGQLISLLGSSLPAFAFEIHVFQYTGAVTPYALIYLFLLLPSLFFSPLTGLLVDYFNKKNLIIFVNICMALNSCIIYLLFLESKLHIINIYIFSIVNSVFNSIQMVALIAILTLSVKQQSYIQSNYLTMLLNTIPRLIGPFLAGYLLTNFGMNNLLLTDIASFSFIIFVAFFIKIKTPEQASPPTKTSFKEDILCGMRFTYKSPALVTLLGFSNLSRFAISLQGIYLFLIILILTNPIQLGIIFIIIGGMQIAGIIMAMLWGGIKANQLKWIPFFSFLQSFFLIVGYIKANPYIMAITCGLFLFIDALSRSCNRAIWQNTVPKNIQGRVFSFTLASLQASAIVAFLIAGPLADKLLIPHLSKSSNEAIVLMRSLTSLGIVYLIISYYLTRKLSQVKYMLTF